MSTIYCTICGDEQNGSDSAIADSASANGSDSASANGSDSASANGSDSASANSANISCNGEDPHTVCLSCFNDYLQNAELFSKLASVWEVHKCIPCPCCDNNFPPRKELRAMDILHLYLDFEFKIQEDKISVLEQKMQESKSTDYASRVYHDICNIATTCKKCPYCLAPFFDFTGCMALHCISCNRHFCGFCLQIHNDDDGISIIEDDTASSRCHKYVKSHTDILSSYDKGIMGITSVYFMREDCWRIHIRDTVMFNLIKEYLFKIKISELYPIMKFVFIKLDSTIISAQNLTILRQYLCSNDSATTHKLRLPAIFATIYSAKRNVRIEDAMDILTPDQKKSMGGVVSKKISSKYPGWEHYKIRVPGEGFDSISYPISMYEDIHNIIEEWGRLPLSGQLWR